MKMVIRNRKGLGYFTMIGPIIIVLFALTQIVLVIPTGNVPEKIDFGETIKDVDLMNSKIPAEKFYKKEELKRLFEKSKIEFTQIPSSSKTQALKRTKTKESDNLITCNFEGLELWYNEKNIAENENNANSKTEAKDEEDNTQNNNDENENEQTDKDKEKDIEKIDTIGYSNCLPEFSDSVEGDFISFFSKNLESELGNALLAQGIEDEPIIDTKYDNESNTISSNIRTYYLEETRVSNMAIELEYNEKYQIKYYTTLIRKLTNDIIPQISQELKDKVPNCLDENDFDEKLCIDKTINELIKNTDPKIHNFYDIKTDIIEEIKSEEYIGIEIEIRDKFTKKKEINFGLILKDNIPYTLIEFNLENSKVADNLINVKIKEPRFSDQVSNYVILYSYHNFFDDMENPQDYNTLIKMLKDSKIPTNFQKTGIFDENMNQYYHSTPENKIYLNLLLSNNEGFIEGENSDNIKNVKIYQIYNHETKKYEILDSSKDLYVFVFATDKNYNYYVEEVQGKTKRISPNTVFGPQPLNENLAQAKGEVALEENTLYFKMGNYTSSGFDHYDIYILENNAEISKKCQNSSEGCYYFDGKDKLITPNNILGLITSQSNIVNSASYDHIIYANEFTNNLFLENGKKYQIYIVPVDLNYNGIIKNTPVEYRYRKSNDITLGNYILERVSGEYLRPFKKDIIIKDNKAPDASSFNILSPSYKIENTKVYLQWQKTPNSDVESLQATIELIYKNGQEPEKFMTTIREDGLAYNGDISQFNQINIKNIVPIDINSNKNSEIANENINTQIILT